MVPDDQFVSNVVIYIIGSSFDQRSFVKVLFFRSEIPSRDEQSSRHLLLTASFSTIADQQHAGKSPEEPHTNNDTDAREGFPGGNVQGQDSQYKRCGFTSTITAPFRFSDP